MPVWGDETQDWDAETLAEMRGRLEEAAVLLVALVKHSFGEPQVVYRQLRHRGAGEPQRGLGPGDALRRIFLPHRHHFRQMIGRGNKPAPSPFVGSWRTAVHNRRTHTMGIGPIIGWLVVGAIAGWIAEKILGRDDSLLMNIVIGIVGAIAGGWLFGVLFGRSLSAESGWIWSILVSVIGALILLWIVGMIRGRRA